MFDALDHVILAVRDLADATRRYATLFARRPSWRGEHPGQGTANTLFRLHNAYLELLSPEGDGPTGRMLAERLDAHGEGPIGLAFATRDADAARAELAAHGLEPAPVTPSLGRDADSGLIRRWRTALLPLARTRGVLLLAIEHGTPDLLPEAAPVGPADAVVSGIDHAVVQTPDADAAIALYRDGLGLRLALDRSFPDWGMRLVFLRVGGVTIELAQPLREVPLQDSDRLWGLSWRVPNADAARARLAAEGVDVSEVRPGRKPGTRVVSVKDGTCGVPTLLIEPEAAA
ncbi:MAG: VOC family protein [Deltaproteobacteria bacterium]|nr:MAG: VOC family protein [Deltaproteobacteria bacterium]